MATSRGAKKWPWLINLFHRLINGSTEEKNAWRTARLDLNPYAWVSGRQPHLDRLVALVMLGWGFVWALVWSRESFSVSVDPWTINLCLMTLQYPLKLWIAGRACHRLVEDRRSGAFELLLSTPLTPKDILAGQRLALRSQFGAPLAGMFFVELLLFLMGLPGARSMNTTATWAVFGAANIIVAGVDIWALVWVGMAHTLTAKSPAKAAAWSVAKIIPLPWFCAWTLIIVASILPFRVLSQAIDLDEKFFIVFVSVVFIINDLFWGLLAKRRLGRDFSHAAMAGVEPRQKR